MKSLWNKQVQQAEEKSIKKDQTWEEHQRQSMENVSNANGWMHYGIQNPHFFYSSILH